MLQCHAATAHLWNGTEVEHAAIAQARQVGDAVRHVTQRVGDELIQTVNSIASLVSNGQLY